MPVLKHSKKRDAILAAICSTDTHPSAEWVYARLKPEIPDLSLGTVYRNIAAFRRDGVIAAICTVDGQERYDGNTCEHVHFICEQCGAVLDIPDVPAALDLKALEARHNVQIDRSVFLLYGKCNDCQN